MREITGTWSNVDYHELTQANRDREFFGGYFLLETTDADDDNGYWLAPGTGVTEDPEQAHIYTYADVIGFMSGQSHTELALYVHKLNPATIGVTTSSVIQPVAPGAKCAIENVLHKPLLDILKFAPEAEMVRARVHAAVLLPIPTEAKTYEQIKTWIESTIVPGTVPTPPPYTPDPIPVAQAPTLAEATPTPTPYPHGIDFTGYMRERESGRASFHREAEGTGDYHFPANRIEQVIRDGLDSGEAWDQIESNLMDIGDEIVNEDPPETEPDTETENFDVDQVTDTQPMNWGPQDRAGFKQEMRDYIRINLPDFYRRIHAQGEENETDVPF